MRKLALACLVCILVGFVLTQEKPLTKDEFNKLKEQPKTIKPLTLAEIKAIADNAAKVECPELAPNVDRLIRQYAGINVRKISLAIDTKCFPWLNKMYGRPNGLGLVILVVPPENGVFSDQITVTMSFE